MLLTLVTRNRFFQVENSMAWQFFGTIRFQRILPFQNGGSFMYSRLLLFVVYSNVERILCLCHILI